MKVEYDPKHDIMNIELVTNMPIAESIELDDGIILDCSEDRKIVSIEVLGVKKKTSARDTRSS